MRLIDADALVPDFLVTIPANNILCKRYVSMEQIQNAPTIEPERKGKWKGYNADDPNWLRTDGSPAFLICSECGQVVVNNFSAHWNYCSNCGAKMEREQKHLGNKSDLVILDEVKGE